LLVLQPETAAPYDTVQMAYSTKPHEVAYFNHHEWSALPAQMLFPLLTETMEKTGYFSVVITPPYPGPYDYALRTKILELQQDFTSDTPAVLLSLRLELTDVATHQVIAANDIVVRQPMSGKTADAGVTAANLAVSTALRRTAGFVLEKASVSETARAP
jgi:cholesterol transport system auxiliary component